MTKENKYYVYGHYTVKDDTLFYVGKGCLKRHSEKQGRSEVWNDFVSSNEWYSKIIKDNLNNFESLELEHALLNSNDNLINLRKNSKELSLDGLENIFYYDESSKSCLRWKVSDTKTNLRSIHVGDSVGFLLRNKNKKCKGYQVSYKSKQFMAHRVVMYLHGIDCTGKVVDHLDGDPSNNKIINLRAITSEQNNRNKSLFENNTTGVSGIDLVLDRGKLCYRVRVMIDNKRVAKRFNVKIYGLIPAFYKACEWRKEQIRLLNEQGAGYTERHGT